MKKFSPKSIIAFSLFFICLMYSGIAQNSLQSMVGMRANSLDGEMGRKGFAFVKSDKTMNGIYSYYWKSANKKCVTTRIVNGKVVSVTNTLPADCNKGGGNSANNHNNNNNNNKNYYNKDYTGDTKLSDLKGWSAARAYDEIRYRGYRHEKDYRNNGKLVKVWYNPKYRKCKKTAEKDGNIDLVENSQQCGK